YAVRNTMVRRHCGYGRALRRVDAQPGAVCDGSAVVRHPATVVCKRENALRILVIAGLLVVIGGCARPPKISATLDVTRRTNDIVLVMLRIKNLEDRATTPLDPEVIVQTRSGSSRDKPVSQIHPAAFVLNK